MSFHILEPSPALLLGRAQSPLMAVELLYALSSASEEAHNPLVLLVALEEPFLVLEPARLLLMHVHPICLDVGLWDWCH